MIQLFERLLKRLGWVAPFDKDDVLNASIEDKQRDTEKVIGRLQYALTKRFASNAHLRETIKLAKHRTNSFEAFERHMVGRRDD